MWVMSTKAVITFRFSGMRGGYSYCYPYKYSIVKFLGGGYATKLRL